MALPPVPVPVIPGAPKKSGFLIRTPAQAAHPPTATDSYDHFRFAVQVVSAYPIFFSSSSCCDWELNVIKFARAKVILALPGFSLFSSATAIIFVFFSFRFAVLCFVWLRVLLLNIVASSLILF
jgi:hypothetical protein